MRMFLKGAAVALALAGTAFVTAGTTGAAGIYVSGDSNRGDYNNDRGDYNGRDRANTTISIGFGDVAFGYRDGYWDNGHRWHHWRHNRDYRTYRGQDGSHYHNYNHDRDSDNGWQRH